MSPPTWFEPNTQVASESAPKVVPAFDISALIAGTMVLLYHVGLSALNVVTYVLIVAFSIPILLWQSIKALAGARRRPSPKCVLITGATSGIGEALALYYARPGVTVALTGRNEAALRDVASRCAAAGATVRTHKGDVTDKDALKRWILEVDVVAPIDLVFANAGVTENTTSTLGDLEGAARVIFATNVDGVFNTIFPVIPRMAERRSGQIVLLSSQAGFGALTGSAAYAASKAAIRVYGDGLRAQLARDGISVNVVCPGYVKSPMTDANKAPQPFKVSMAYAIDCIAKGVAADLPLISFPSATYAGAWMLGVLPPLVRDFLARARVFPQISYMRNKRNVGHASSAGAAR